MTTCGSNIELTRELFANSMRAVQSIVCLENVSELPFSSSRADRKQVAMKESPLVNENPNWRIGQRRRAQRGGQVCGEVIMQWQTKAAAASEGRR